MLSSSSSPRSVGVKPSVGGDSSCCGRRTNYQVADWAAKYALSNLSLGSTSREQQLVAFWAPFLLLHLGGPDNISAYSLEDNVLWVRFMLNALFQFGGALIVLYKHVLRGSGSGTLRWATLIMFLAGLAKYGERVFALWQGDLGRIRSSVKKQKPRRFMADQLGGCELDDEKALLVAHDLFPICKGAFADYSHEHPHRLKREARRKPLPLKWSDMCKVVEMELSLMYDILYTKAAVIHTWHGYIIRVLSPPFTAAASLLFFYYSKDGQRREDVFFTYILLAATFLLDMRWLLKALGSTWTYAFLYATCWLHHAFLCTGRWHRLRCLVVSLYPSRLLCRAPSSSYRMWSGTIGQYNLLHECTRDTPTGLCSKLGKLAKWAGLEDSWNEYQYHYLRGRDISKGRVRELLFETIRDELKKAHPVKDESPVPVEKAPMKAAMYELSLDRERDENLNFGPEFQEVILIWHIATDFFLLNRDQNAASCTRVKVIKALSDYMVFIVTVRPDMLPGLKLKSMHEATSKALVKIWCKQGYSSSSRISPGSTTREEKIARILQKMEDINIIDPKKDYRSVLYKKSIILSDGTKYAKVLLTLLCDGRWVWEKPGDKSEERFRKILEDFILELREAQCETEGLVSRWKVVDMEELLQQILEAWVRLLIYVSVRCSRDSHAKQLSRGGELTTIVWILSKHAGIFGIKE